MIEDKDEAILDPHLCSLVKKAFRNDICPCCKQKMLEEAKVNNHNFKDVPENYREDKE